MSFYDISLKLSDKTVRWVRYGSITPDFYAAGGVATGISGRGTENICPGTASWPLLDWASSPGSMPLLL